jgi:pumilio RNA-binding family
VEYIDAEHKASFVQELDAHLMRCVKDANGNHVIQKMVECVPPERLEFVHTFRGNVYELSTHPYGCRVLQRCFEHLPEEQTRPLLDELHKYTANLMQDQFGVGHDLASSTLGSFPLTSSVCLLTRTQNYVIQFVLEHGMPHDRDQVVSRLRGQMLHMARHKFASNVCEKALTCSTRENRTALIAEIMAPKPDGTAPIAVMMKDQFANYVLQRALTVVDEDQREELCAKVRPHLASMRRYSSAYSKHLIASELLSFRLS